MQTSEAKKHIVVISSSTATIMRFDAGRIDNMADVFCLCFDYLAEKLSIKPLAEFAACNLIGLAMGADAPQTGVVVGYTYSREAAEQIIKEKRLEALCKMNIYIFKDYQALEAERRNRELAFANLHEAAENNKPDTEEGNII